MSDQHGAGRELDCRIHKFIFGVQPRLVRCAGSDEFVVVYAANHHLNDGRWSRIELERHGAPPKYSTEIAAAWLVVEHLRERFGQVELYGERNHCWDCVVSDWGGMTVLAREGGETPMLAVCRAALASLPAGGK